MINVYVFQVNVNKYGTDELVKKMFFIGHSVFHVSHIASEMIFGGNMFKLPIEIGAILKVAGVDAIENPESILDMLDDDEDNEDEHGHNVFTGDIPLKIAQNLTDEQTITFKCECHEELRIPINMGFPFVKCPNCSLEIKPIEIKNAGGIYFYEKQKRRK
jgi:hypothetical protein